MSQEKKTCACACGQMKLPPICPDFEGACLDKSSCTGCPSEWKKTTPIKQDLKPCPHQTKGGPDDWWRYKCPEGCDKC